MNLRPWTYPENTPETRKKIITFLLCLFFSFVAWLSIKLSKETSTVFPVELSIPNIPDNLIFSAQSDSAFLLSLQTTGIKILSTRNMRGLRKLDIDFSSLQKIRKESGSLFFITAVQAETRISLLNDIPRASIKLHPDTLFFVASDAFRKKVPVIVQKELDFRRGFKNYNFPVVSPDSVFIAGPKNLEDSVNFILTSAVTAIAADKNITQRVSLINPYPNNLTEISDLHAEVFIQVEEYTEAHFELPILIDCPTMEQQSPGSKIMLFPEKATVFYLVALKDIKMITPEMFKLTVTCPDTLSFDPTRLPVVVSEFPGLVEIIRTRPSEVEYVWIKN
jgi:hypothetical protein